MTWVEIKDSMKTYCEKFFYAVETWRNYESIDILQNRILLVATLCKIFHEDVYDESILTYKLETQIDIQQRNINDNLLPEYISNSTSDIEAFQKARQLVLDKKTFKNVGIYFQENLLKALAGWSPEMLLKSNKTTRKHLIDCTLLLFRLPESAGIITIKRICDSANTNSSSNNNNDNSSNSVIVPLVELNLNTIESSNKDSHHPGDLYNFLLETRKKSYTSKTEFTIKNGSAIGKNINGVIIGTNRNHTTDDDNDNNYDDDECNHQSFQDENTHISSSSSSTPSFSPSSSSSSSSLLLKSLKKQKRQQDDGYSFVGLNVLQYFITGKGLKQLSTPFIGEVKTYLPETSLNGIKDDEMWHIVWEDGDECDYDKKELERGRQDYLDHYNSNNNKPKKKNITTNTIGRRRSSSSSSSSSSSNNMNIIINKKKRK